MTYASTSASFTGRTNAAAAVRKPLHVFRGRKSSPQSNSCKPGRREAHNLGETRAKDIGMEAFHDMFVASRPKFVGIAHAILRNREDAEDAVQNAFLSGYRHFRSFEGRSAVTTWFTRIVLNAALMIQRKHKLSRIKPLPETSISPEANWMERVPSLQPDPEMVHAERETLQVINEMLGKMKPALRQAFTMTYYDELSGREACARLGIAAGTFKARLFRARRYLANHAPHSLVAPLRKTMPLVSFLSGKNDSQPLATTARDISSVEVAFS